MRFFQEHEYISIDLTRQDVLRVRVRQSPAGMLSALLPEDTQPEINFEKLPTTPGEPLRTELLSFAQSVRTRKRPIIDGEAGRRALELADRVMAGILEHARRVKVGRSLHRKFHDPRTLVPVNVRPSQPTKRNEPAIAQPLIWTTGR